MPSPAPALHTLKDQLAKAFRMPTAQLGIMADARHIKGGTSDHINGDAIDIPTTTSAAFMLGLARLLLHDPRTHYVIWARTFYHAGRKPARYTGSDPHTSHIHLSIHPTKRADALPWDIATTSPKPAKPLKPGTCVLLRNTAVYRGPDLNVPADNHIIDTAHKGGVMTCGEQKHGMLHVSNAVMNGWVVPSAVKKG